MTSLPNSKFSKHVMNGVTGRCMYCGCTAVDMMRGKVDCNWCKGPVGMWPLPPSGYIPKKEGVLDPCLPKSSPESTSPSPREEPTRREEEEVFNRKEFDKFMRGL